MGNPLPCGADEERREPMATGHIDAGKLDERVKVLDLAEASPGVSA